MTVTDAVRQANTEHVVYFLLTAYVDALGYTGHSSVPAPAARLPIVTITDVQERLEVLRGALASPSRSTPDATPLIEEAAGLFSVASERLEHIAEVAPAIAGQLQRQASRNLTAGTFGFGVVHKGVGE